MKTYKVVYSDHITKDLHVKQIYAKNKKEARGKFNGMWNNPYPIIKIEEVS